MSPLRVPGDSPGCTRTPDPGANFGHLAEVLATGTEELFTRVGLTVRFDRVPIAYCSCHAADPWNPLAPKQKIPPSAATNR